MSGKQNMLSANNLVQSETNLYVQFKFYKHEANNKFRVIK